MARTSKTSTTSTDIATQTAEDHIARLEVIEQKLRAPIPTTEATTMGEKAPCSQCGAEVARKSLRKGTCRKCVRSNLATLHGEEPSAAVETDVAQEPADASVEPEVQAAPTAARHLRRLQALEQKPRAPVEQAAPAVEDAPAAPPASDVEAPSTGTSAGSGAAQMTDPRVAYLIDLVTQGEGAIAQALRSRRVVVHLPKVKRAAKAPKAKAEGKTASSIKHKLNLDIARDVRRRIAEAKASGKGKGIENVIAAELGVHYTTVADVRDGKIWKEPAAQA
jgi:hypothetical protein